MLLELFFVFFFSFASLFFLRKVAHNIGLIDTPSLRKRHTGEIPLVGGIAVFVTIAQFVYNKPFLLPHYQSFLIAIGLITVIGAIDDKFDISFKIRLFVQALLTVFVMYYSEVELNNIGDIFGLGEIELGALAPLFTVLAVIAAINAFNMVDGIDGLLGGLSIVTFLSLAIIINQSGNSHLSYFCIVIIVAMIPYVLMNLGVLGKKRQVFMGDAGSMLIGFTVIWVILFASQENEAPIMRPVTALWIIALPLMDMAAIVYRRIKRKRSPFRPDRDHLHHICQRMGYSKIQTLFIICGMAALFAAIGISSEFVNVPEYIMFWLFIALFISYSLMLLRRLPY